MDKPWKVVLAFIGVFIAGAVFGGVFSLGIGKRLFQAQAAAQPALTAKVAAPVQPADKTKKAATAAGGQFMGAPQLMRYYVKRLGLTPEQMVRVNPILQRAAEDYRRQQVNSLRETNFILQRLQQDIKKELTPDQQDKLEELEQHQREMLKEKAAQGMRKAGKTPPEGGAPDAKMAPAPAGPASPAPAGTKPPAATEPKKP